MQNRKFSMILGLLFSLYTRFSLGTGIQTPPEAIIQLADFSEDFDVGDVKICAEGNIQCLKVTCIDVCIAAGEDVSDCPLYCNTYTEYRYFHPVGCMALSRNRVILLNP